MTPKPVQGAHLVLATATLLKSLMGRNIKISKQKMHALLHFSHSTGDKFQFPEIRHDTAVKICQMECRPRTQLWCVQCSHLVPGGACCNHTSGIPASGQDGITETGDTLSLETTKSWIKHTKQQLRDTLHQAAKCGAPERWVQVQ